MRDELRINKQVVDIFERTAKNLNLSDFSCKLYSQEEIKQLFNTIGNDYLLILYDSSLGVENYLNLKETVASRNELVVLVLIIEETHHLKDYLRFTYCPDGVLFTPLISRDIEQLIVKVQCMKDSNHKHTPNSSFKIRHRGSIITISLDDIVFFESRGKQIALRTRGQEMLFYSNYKQVQDQLNEQFIRCHKGYIVNKSLIRQVLYNQMQVIMVDQSRIPLSRKFKEQFKTSLGATTDE